MPKKTNVDDLTPNLFDDDTIKEIGIINTIESIIKYNERNRYGTIKNDITRENIQGFNRSNEEYEITRGVYNNDKGMGENISKNNEDDIVRGFERSDSKSIRTRRPIEQTLFSDTTSISRSEPRENNRMGDVWGGIQENKQRISGRRENQESTNRVDYKNNNEVVIGSLKDRFNKNIESIKMLKTLELENRFATNKEQEILSNFSGCGGR